MPRPSRGRGRGRREYGRATLLTAELLLSRLATAAATHATVLGPGGG